MENTAEKKYRFDVTSSALKWVAIITMLIDHIGAAILEWSFVSGDYLMDSTALGVLDTVLRAIGRTAFPIFIFLMAEGFYYTRSRTNYLLRMLAFCMVSEIPFDMAFGYYHTNESDIRQNLFVPDYQNVFFTLTLGLFAIWVMNLFYERMPSVIMEIVLDVAVLCGAGYLAHFLKTDYGASGVIAIVAAHMAKRFKLKPVLSGVIIILILTLTSSVFEIAAAVIALPLLVFYHGNRGYRFNKWIFYVFYPAHLFLLALIRTVIFA